MKKFLLNHKGLSIIEMLVASALLGVVALAIHTVVANLIRGGARVEQKVSLQKIVRSLIYQVSTREQNLPGVIPDSRFSNPAFDPYNDPTIANETCFTRTGEEGSSNSPDCFYKIKYFRLQIIDTKFKQGSDLGRLPLVRLQVKISYTENRKPKDIYVSQFLTSYLSQ